MRLIDADALIEDLVNLEVVGGHGMYRKGCNHTLHGLVPEMINAQHVVDAAPVVHGRWEKSDWLMCNEYVGYYSIPSGGVTCTRCRNAFSRELLGTRGNYCPNCGAKMDGE